MSLTPAPRARTAGGDSATRGWLRALELTAPIAKHPTRILPTVVAELATRHGDAVALLSDQETFSFRALADRASRYAAWALREGLNKGDVVALLMPNGPEYMAVWLGITRIGGVVSLINTNLIGPSLAHCIDIVGPKHIIVADELREAFAATLPDLASSPRIWSHGKERGYPNIEHALASAEPFASSQIPAITIADCALHIYTSGTTGLPKAARISHGRLMTWSFWFAGMMGVGPSDRMYNCLPMYHSTGGVVATGAMLVNGGSVAIRDKFSARQFWDDLTRFDCTLFQYIGELCRYLVHSPPHPCERSHRLRLACGNGLRADVWETFKDRFNIPQVLEFYAATEGNATIFNADGKPGAIGRMPPFLAHRSPTALVRLDIEAGKPVRDAQGFCIPCAPDEVGEALGRIGNGPGSFGGRFEGYTSREDSERKILRDVFARGDAWFRTGDLMRKDATGYFYFVDRIGDTFRWKGENVSTSEVGEALLAYPGISEATVYGVAIPGTEGRAGMAAVVCKGALDFTSLLAHLAPRLPAYARPIFLRVCREIETTATFKHKKSDLAREGFDPAATTDPIYAYDPELEAYAPVDGTLFRRIQRGQVRF